jgi:flagellar protein FliO/FliZ
MGLFGAEMPMYVQLFLALLIVLGLIGAAAWAVRRFGGTHLGGTVRGRQPRLGVIEYATVDTRRRLLLVRRDNIEHLVLIGGPTDVVVEANIVRAAPAASRDPVGGRITAVDSLTRTVALPEAASNGSWPLQPEEPAIPVAPMAPMTPPAPPRRARIEPLSEEPLAAPPSPIEPIIRPQREALTALADDLASVAPPPMPVTPPARSRMSPRLQPAEPRIEPSRPFASDAGSTDQSLAEMAQRLEAALRKPTAEMRTPPAPPADETDQIEEPMAPPPPPMRATRPAEMKPARAEAKPKEGKALYDSLEQEMASLLGRPATKN